MSKWLGGLVLTLMAIGIIRQFIIEIGPMLLSASLTDWLAAAGVVGIVFFIAR